MSEKHYMMLACPTLRSEITAFMKEDGLNYPVFYIPDELHLVPEKLKEYLCDFIPRLVNVDYLLLPMGRCGDGTVGVPSCNTTLVLPRCDDCISLLLSDKSLSDVKRPEYSYFFTDSWLDLKHAFLSEYDYTLNKYGQETGDSIMKAIYHSYRYFMYVDSGFGNYESASTRVAQLAKAVDMEVKKLDASCGVLRKMLRLDFDEDFLIVPPGQEVVF